MRIPREPTPYMKVMATIKLLNTLYHLKIKKDGNVRGVIQFMDRIDKTCSQ